MTDPNCGVTKTAKNDNCPDKEEAEEMTTYKVAVGPDGSLNLAQKLENVLHKKRINERIFGGGILRFCILFWGPFCALVWLYILSLNSTL